jgi:UDP-GlcNAc:undecaprenyl-phosphate GlcNAc-1-phosphate transferase
MDGLATGIASIVSLMFFIVAFSSGQWWFGLLSCALLGATLGFLPFNVHPAKIFIGNGGSLFLGFTLGTIAVMGEWSESRFIALTIPLLILAIPIFDILYVVILRYRQGLTPTLPEIINYCGKDHLSHRLLRLGFRQRGVVILLYILSLCLGLGAIMLKVEMNAYDAAILIVQAAMIILIVGALLNIKENNQHRP